MQPFHEVRLIAGRELQKSFRSAKGLALAALSVVAGGGLSLLFAWIDRLRVEHLPEGTDPAALRAMQEDFFTRMYDAETARSLTEAPYALWMMLMATLTGLPLLVALLGFDGVSAEVAARTVRFWTVRSRRASYVIGKLLGLWIAVLAVTLGTHVIVWGAVAYVGHERIDHVALWGLRFFAVVVPVSAAWCGLATLVGSQFRSPMLALLSICAATFGVWVARVVAGLQRVDALAYIDPNAYDGLLVAPRVRDVALGVAGLLAMVVVTGAAASLAFERRDL
jgi:ABC-2 type transport system permease protein